MLGPFAHSLRTVLTVKCTTRSHENDARSCKSVASYDIITVFRLPIASQHVWKRIWFLQDTEGGGGGRGGMKCALAVCYIEISMYLSWIYFDKDLLSALTSPKFSLPYVTFRTLNALNVQITGFKIISKPINFTSPKESNNFARKNSSLETTKHLVTNNYFHFCRWLLYSHIFLASRKDT